MAAWPVLLCAAAGPPMGPECPQEVGYLSPRRASGFLLAASARYFAMSLKKAFIPGRIEEWNAPCQQG